MQVKHRAAPLNAHAKVVYIYIYIYIFIYFTAHLEVIMAISVSQWVVSTLQCDV